MDTQIVSVLFLIVIILYITYTSNRIQDLAIPKTMEKTKQQRELYSDFHQKLIDTALCHGVQLNMYFHEVLRISSPVILAIHLFVKHTDSHFPKIVQSYLECLKIGNSSKPEV